MATLKEATLNAIHFAQESLGAERTSGVRLEEVEVDTSKGEALWIFTLSMVSTADSEGPLGDMLKSLAKPRREYKTFVVSKSSGEVLAMRIRELADA